MERYEKENLHFYEQYGKLILDSFKELNIYLNGYRDLQNSGNGTDGGLYLFSSI